MQPAEQIAIAGKISAIQKRNRELSIVGVVTVAFGEGARSWTQLEAKVPQFLRETSYAIFEELLGITIAEEEKDIDVGVRKEPAAAESSRGHQGKIVRLRFVGGDHIVPEPSEDIFDQVGALCDTRAAVARG